MSHPFRLVAVLVLAPLLLSGSLLAQIPDSSSVQVVDSSPEALPVGWPCAATEGGSPLDTATAVHTNSRFAAQSLSESTVCVITDLQAFIAETNAQLVPAPANDINASSLDFPGLTITAPHGLHRHEFGAWGVILIDIPPISPWFAISNSVPYGICAHGEDDLLFHFSPPVTAFGLDIHHNGAGGESFQLKDQNGRLIFSCAGVPGPFIGFVSTTPIASMFFNNVGGAEANVAVIGMYLKSGSRVLSVTANPAPVRLEKKWHQARYFLEIPQGLIGKFFQGQNLRSAFALLFCKSRAKVAETVYHAK